MKAFIVTYNCLDIVCHFVLFGNTPKEAVCKELKLNNKDVISLTKRKLLVNVGDPVLEKRNSGNVLVQKAEIIKHLEIKEVEKVEVITKKDFKIYPKKNGRTYFFTTTKLFESEVKGK